MQRYWPFMMKVLRFALAIVFVLAYIAPFTTPTKETQAHLNPGRIARDVSKSNHFLDQYIAGQLADLQKRANEVLKANNHQTSLERQKCITDMNILTLSTLSCLYQYLAFGDDSDSIIRRFFDQDSLDTGRWLSAAHEIKKRQSGDPVVLGHFTDLIKAWKSWHDQLSNLETREALDPIIHESITRNPFKTRNTAIEAIIELQRHWLRTENLALHSKWGPEQSAYYDIRDVKYNIGFLGAYHHLIYDLPKYLCRKTQSDTTQWRSENKPTDSFWSEQLFYWQGMCTKGHDPTLFMEDQEIFKLSNFIITQLLDLRDTRRKFELGFSGYLNSLNSDLVADALDRALLVRFKDSETFQQHTKPDMFIRYCENMAGNLISATEQRLKDAIVVYGLLKQYRLYQFSEDENLSDYQPTHLEKIHNRDQEAGTRTLEYQFSAGQNPSDDPPTQLEEIQNIGKETGTRTLGHQFSRDKKLSNDRPTKMEIHNIGKEIGTRTLGVQSNVNILRRMASLDKVKIPLQSQSSTTTPIDIDNNPNENTSTSNTYIEMSQRRFLDVWSKLAEAVSTLDSKIPNLIDKIKSDTLPRLLSEINTALGIIVAGKKSDSAKLNSVLSKALSSYNEIATLVPEIADIKYSKATNDESKPDLIGELWLLSNRLRHKVIQNNRKWNEELENTVIILHWVLKLPIQFRRRQPERYISWEDVIPSRGWGARAWDSVSKYANLRRRGDETVS
jgi:hypothetical protein